MVVIKHYNIIVLQHVFDVYSEHSLEINVLRKEYMYMYNTHVLYMYMYYRCSITCTCACTIDVVFRGGNKTINLQGQHV